MNRILPTRIRTGYVRVRVCACKKKIWKRTEKITYCITEKITYCITRILRQKSGLGKSMVRGKLSLICNKAVFITYVFYSCIYYFTLDITLLLHCRVYILYIYLLSVVFFIFNWLMIALQY